MDPQFLYVCTGCVELAAVIFLQLFVLDVDIDLLVEAAQPDCAQLVSAFVDARQVAHWESKIGTALEE
jgi:hypothetical protein